MQLRVARHTERLDEVVAFYRDGIGLTEVGGFRDHHGYDGVFLAAPRTGAHLELTSGGGHGAPAPHPEPLPVLYLGDDEGVQTVAGRLGVDPITPANPYWAEHGVTFQDPDGFGVVLVPERWERKARMRSLSLRTKSGRGSLGGLPHSSEVGCRCLGRPGPPGAQRAKLPAGQGAPE